MTGITRKWATLVGVLLMATALGCASTSKSEGTGEYFDDTVITGKVKAAIFNEPTLKSAEINVETAPESCHSRTATLKFFRRGKR